MRNQSQQRAPLSLGVDLGDACCQMAGLRDAGSEPIYMDDGGESYPAVAAMDEGRNWLFGPSALDSAQEPGVTRFKNLSSSISREGSPRGEEVARRLLKKLKTEFQVKCASRVSAAVLCVPYTYTLQQREALRRAAEESPMPVAGLVNAPEAAVLGYRLDEKLSGGQENVLVFDAGASRCTASVLRVSKKDDVLDIRLLSEATAEDSEGQPVGGETLDLRLYDAFEKGALPGLPRPSGALSAADRAGARKVLRDARHRLAWQDEVEFALPWDGTGTGKLTLSDLQRWADIDDEIVQAIRKALRTANPNGQSGGLAPSQVHRVLVVGGLARSPRMLSVLDSFPNVEPVPEERFEERVLALGAARCAAILSGADSETVFAPHHTPAFGFRLKGDSFDHVIPENAPIGFVGRRLYTLPPEETYVLHLEMCEGFSNRYTPLGAGRWKRLELKPPRGHYAGNPVNWRVLVEMERRAAGLAVRVYDQTAGDGDAKVGDFEFPLQ